MLDLGEKPWRSTTGCASRRTRVPPAVNDAIIAGPPATSPTSLSGVFDGALRSYPPALDGYGRDGSTLTR